MTAPRKMTKGAAVPSRSARPGACEATLIAAGLVSYASDPESPYRRFYGDIDGIFGSDTDLCALHDTPWEDLVHEEDRVLVGPDAYPNQPGEAYRLNYRVRLPSGRVIAVQDSGSISPDPGTGMLRRAGILTDASRVHALEERLRYVHRMEAFGQLTGGVAHDFNNLLTLLRGYAELLQGEIGSDSPRSDYVEEMIRAADRAVDVTQQLQSFCRVRQRPMPGVVEPGNCVLGLRRMLRRMVGEEIEFVIDVAEKSGAVLAAPSQIDTIVMQLVAHAREGLPPGSRLGLSVFETTVRSNDRRVRHEGWTPGPYLVIAVETRLPRKKSATNAALHRDVASLKGLAEAWELWSTAGGQFEIRSESGRSQRIAAFMPRIRPLPAPEEVPTDATEPPYGNGENILIVEDDAETLRLYSMGVERLGYTVLTASHGEEALRIARRHPEIDLVLTDLVMPLMGGVELAEELGSVLPSARILLMSGYTANGSGSADGEHEGYPFLSKPFSLKTLAQKISEFIENR